MRASVLEEHVAQCFRDPSSTRIHDYARGIFRNETNRRVEFKLGAFAWGRLGNVQEFFREETTIGYEVMGLS